MWNSVWATFDLEYYTEECSFKISCLKWLFFFFGKLSGLGFFAGGQLSFIGRVICIGSESSYYKKILWLTHSNHNTFSVGILRVYLPFIYILS